MIYEINPTRYQYVSLLPCLNNVLNSRLLFVILILPLIRTICTQIWYDLIIEWSKLFTNCVEIIAFRWASFNVHIRLNMSVPHLCNCPVTRNLTWLSPSEASVIKSGILTALWSHFVRLLSKWISYLGGI